MNMKKIIENLKIIFKTSYWYQQGEYCKMHDDALLELLSKYEFVPNDGVTSFLGRAEIWIENHPYNSYRIWDDAFKGTRPSRKTMIKAHKKRMDGKAKERQEKIDKFKKCCI